MPPPATLEFGDEPRGGPGRRWVAGLRDDPRLAPVAAGLGGVALVLSVLSEWQVTSVTGGLFGGGEDEPVDARPLTTGIGDLGGWTAGYVAGLVVLVAAVTVLLFGPRAGRAYARLVTLSTAGVLAVVLLALSGPLADTSFALPVFLTYDVPEGRYEIARGRGVWCALAGVLILAFAAWLSRTPAAPATAAAAAEEPADDAAEDWPWRRPGGAPAADGERPEEPADLTVGPATPFTPLPGDRDTTDDGAWRGPGRHIG
ncbi:hypothetical protein Sya03_18780 [Spirilliplanes yamanashiensis]|uniref:Uncharacterized protein n=1 Tax=Spirilliplanes yamanashiensis TaxID=42233 RepID=A0A8J3Y639_9ACTN|nr:hypothetical protein Sya03_18780 [Spirilliplanes yamanashiensis]